MVAFNFQRRFVEPIKSGVKTSTIRRRYRAGLEVGCSLQLYVDQQLPTCEKIISDQICKSVSHVQVLVLEKCVVINSKVFLYQGPELNDFIKKEGFTCANTFFQFFFKTYDTLRFNGDLIEWG